MLARMHHRSVVAGAAIYVAAASLWACTSSSAGSGSSASGGQAAGGSSSGGTPAAGGGIGSGGRPGSGGITSAGAGGSTGVSSEGGGRTTGGAVGSGGAAGGSVGTRGSSGGAAGSGGAGGGVAGPGGATGGNGGSGGFQSGGMGGASSSGGASLGTGGAIASGGSAGGVGGGAGGSFTGGAGGGDAALADVPPGRDTPADGPAPFVFGQPPAAVAHFKQGINLGNRLEAPNEGDWGGKVLASDFPFIAKRGFDHVRIPMKWSGHAQTSAPYTIDSAFFTRIDTVLDQALAANLAVIVDMHAYDEMASDPGGQRQRFLGLWSQIASRYRDRPDTVAFELLNEPNSQLDGSWNDLAAAAISTVRATNPRRLLIVDAVFWADPSKLASLMLPNDANLLVAVHLYEPKLFSMQGKSWMGPEYMTTGVIFPGPPASPITPVAAATAASWAKRWFDDYNTLPAATNPSGPATITAQVAYLTTYREAQGRTVYNGEWGPQDGGAMDSRVRLVTEVRKQCEQAGIGWAIWDDPVNMNLFDSAAGTWVSQIVDALLP
jgi:endoglucanase